MIMSNGNAPHEPKPKHPGGRPTKYQPEFCDEIIEMGNQGYSVHEMAKKLQVNHTSLYEWARKHPEFSTAFSRARNNSMAFLITEARRNMANRDFQPKLWEYMMRFVHGCKETRNPVILDFDTCKTLEEKCDKILSHTMKGEISPDDCEKLIRAVCNRAGLKIDEIDKKVTELTEKLKNL